MCSALHKQVCSPLPDCASLTRNHFTAVLFLLCFDLWPASDLNLCLALHFWKSAFFVIWPSALITDSAFSGDLACGSIPWWLCMKHWLHLDLLDFCILDLVLIAWVMCLGPITLTFVFSFGVLSFLYRSQQPPRVTELYPFSNSLWTTSPITWTSAIFLNWGHLFLTHIIHSPMLHSPWSFH